MAVFTSFPVRSSSRRASPWLTPPTVAVILSARRTSFFEVVLTSTIQLR